MSAIKVTAAAALVAVAPPTDPGTRSFMPGLVSSEVSEVRLTISPDGRTMVFGRIAAGGDLDLVVTHRQGGRWSPAAKVPFSAVGNDFDPSFTPDGRSLLFFSNRPGGFGKDDIWQVSFDPRAARFGTPRNVGPNVNSGGSEWAPMLSFDGRTLLFSSDGRGGRGKQDLLTAPRVGGRYRPARLLPGAVNGPDDEFDATFIDRRGTLVFSRGNAESGPVQLYLSSLTARGYGQPRHLPPPINCSVFVIGPSVASARPGRFFWSANCPGSTRGRMDIMEASLSLVRQFQKEAR